MENNYVLAIREYFEDTFGGQAIILVHEHKNVIMLEICFTELNNKYFSFALNKNGLDLGLDSTCLTIANRINDELKGRNE